jgi:superfamily II DNA helicase RecQ
MESEVKDKFMLYRSVTVRSSTVRTNLIYKIQIMDSKNDQFLDDAADVIQQYLATPSSSKDRAIVFCRSKQDTHAISSLLSQNETG